MSDVRARAIEAIWDTVHAVLHEQRSCFNPDHEAAVEALERLANNHDCYCYGMPHSQLCIDARAALARLRKTVPA